VSSIIKGTLDRKLVIYRPGLNNFEHDIVAYAGADLAGDPDDSKSTSGYVVYTHHLQTKETVHYGSVYDGC